MNENPVKHALLVLVMVALMVGGGLIQAGRAATPGSASRPAPAAARVAAPVALSVSVSSCNHAH